MKETLLRRFPEANLQRELHQECSKKVHPRVYIQFASMGTLAPNARRTPTSAIPLLLSQCGEVVSRDACLWLARCSGRGSSGQCADRRTDGMTLHVAEKQGCKLMGQWELGLVRGLEVCIPLATKSLLVTNILGQIAMVCGIVSCNYRSGPY